MTALDDNDGNDDSPQLSICPRDSTADPAAFVCRPGQIVFLFSHGEFNVPEIALDDRLLVGGPVVFMGLLRWSGLLWSTRDAKYANVKIFESPFAGIIAQSYQMCK